MGSVPTVNHTGFEPGEDFNVEDRGFETPCWVWAKGATSYGQIVRNGKRWAHRIAYEAACGPIPEDCIVHHRCGVGRCINPDHLEAVTPVEHYERHEQMKAQVPPTSTFGRNLRLRRREMGLSQHDLGVDVGTNSVTISRIERGKGLPRLELAYVIARRLGCTLDDLFNEHEEAA